jgi:hypothetical protein
MKKILEKNVAELLLITLLLVTILSSCASSNHYLCDAYASVEVKNEMK